MIVVPWHLQEIPRARRLPRQVRGGAAFTLGAPVALLTGCSALRVSLYPAVISPSPYSVTGGVHEFQLRNIFSLSMFSSLLLPSPFCLRSSRNRKVQADIWVFFAVVTDGYGLAYAIGDDYIRWTITSLKLDTAKLKQYLAEAAAEVGQMMERAAKAETGEKPKL